MEPAEDEVKAAKGGAGDRELVAALLRNDQQAWVRLLETVARPLAETRKYREMVERMGLSVEDILAQLCEELYADDFARIRAFRFQGSLAAWMFWEVRNAFRNLVRGTEVREESVDPTEEFAFGEELVAQPNAARDDLDEARAYFARLWHENPSGAFALFLKGELGVDTVLASRLIGKPPNTVDKMVSRARDRMRELRQISVGRRS